MNALFPPAVTEPRTLRLYQESAIEMLRESLRTGHCRPILQLPTGAGKTRIAAELVLGSLSKERAIIVVPRLSLIEQTVAAFEREGIWGLGVLQGRHFRTNPNAPVQIASAQTLVRRDIPSAGIVIVDECHLQFEKINKWIASPEWSAVPFVGLSATPWSRGLGKNYDDLLRPVSIQELIDEGYLSPFRVFAPPAPDLTCVRTVAGEFHEADLSDACDKTEIVADVVRTWFEKGENRRTLCYGVDRKHAQHLQERFVEAGIRTEYIDCDVELFEREEIFDRFRAGETRVICNVATLDTGIDLDVRCIIDACGFTIFATTEVTERDGELVELGSHRSGSVSDRHKQEWAKKDLWHGALIKISRQKGYKPGWAAHKFREKFGVWPTLNYPPEREPTVEILNWVRSRNIAFAKARARYG